MIAKKKIEQYRIILISQIKKIIVQKGRQKNFAGARSELIYGN